jgi:hypothetical protein
MLHVIFFRRTVGTAIYIFNWTENCNSDPHDMHFKYLIQQNCWTVRNSLGDLKEYQLMERIHNQERLGTLIGP